MVGIVNRISKVGNRMTTELAQFKYGEQQETVVKSFFHYSFELFSLVICDEEWFLFLDSSKVTNRSFFDLHRAHD